MLWRAGASLSFVFLGFFVGNRWNNFWIGHQHCVSGTGVFTTQVLVLGLFNKNTAPTKITVIAVE